MDTTLKPIESNKLMPLWSDFKYFDHQPEAIEWMMKQESEGAYVRGVPVFGGVLGDEMGLGKTIEVAGLIVNRRVRRTLILAPVAVIGTWISVMQRTGLTVWTWNKGQWATDRVRTGAAVYITNLEKLFSGAAGGTWDRVIIDEAHRLRNHKSALAKACCKIEASSRWALTATPIVNSMDDVRSLFAFLRMPRTKDILSVAPKLVYHRSLAELRATLPDAPPEPRIERLVVPFATAEEEEFYYGIQGAIEANLERYSHDRDRNAAIFKLLLRLRQISVHPQVYIDAMRRENQYLFKKYDRPDWTGPATKFEAVAKLLEVKKKTIIICHFKEEIQALQRFLASKRLASAIFEYSGSVPQDERDAIVAAAQNGDQGTVILVQLQAGGVGINLQTFERVIFLSPWWNSALVDQAIGRAVRMGQKAVVEVYHIMFECEEAMEGSIVIDQFMNSKVEEKREMLLNFWSVCDAVRSAQPIKMEEAAMTTIRDMAVDEDPMMIAT
jgi:SNF2 family DNA or RNA helicase